MARTAKSYTPRIHGAAMNALRATAELLGEAGLGPFRESAAGWEFEPRHPGVTALRLTWANSRKFLGGVYRAVLEAEFSTAHDADGGLRLHYAGLLLKGAPELRPEKPSASGATLRLAALLNADAELSRLFAVQDIEKLTLEPKPGSRSLTLRLTPIGGSFVWMLLPPVKYAVRLPARHAKAMVDTVRRLAALVGAGEPGAPAGPTGEDGEDAPDGPNGPRGPHCGAMDAASRLHEHTREEYT